MTGAVRSRGVQMIERPWGITAFSTASVQAPPDLARLRSRVSRLQQSPAQAFAGTSEAVGEVRRVIRELDAVQRLLVDVVAAGANEIQGVSFDVIDKPALRAGARREAVATARRKAQLYAEAAGVRLGALVYIDDVDPEKLGEGGYRSHSSANAEASAEDLGLSRCGPRARRPRSCSWAIQETYARRDSFRVRGPGKFASAAIPAAPPPTATCRPDGLAIPPAPAGPCHT